MRKLNKMPVQFSLKKPLVKSYRIYCDKVGESYSEFVELAIKHELLRRVEFNRDKLITGVY